jgi:hypothetical protein
VNVCQARWVRFAKTASKADLFGHESLCERLSSALGSFRKSGFPSSIRRQPCEYAHSIFMGLRAGRRRDSSFGIFWGFRQANRTITQARRLEYAFYVFASIFLAAAMVSSISSLGAILLFVAGRPIGLTCGPATIGLHKQ